MIDFLKSPDDSPRHLGTATAGAQYLNLHNILRRNCRYIPFKGVMHILDPLWVEIRNALHFFQKLFDGLNSIVLKLQQAKIMEVRISVSVIIIET